LVSREWLHLAQIQCFLFVHCYTHSDFSCLTGEVLTMLRSKKFSTMKGIGTEYAHLYLATGVTLGATHHEPAEVMTVHTLSVEQVLAMARTGEIHNAISVLALLLAFGG